MERRDIRLAEVIHHALLELIPYGLKDPRVETTSVLKVELTPDLKMARVLVDVTGSEEEKSKAMRGLESAKGFLRRELAVKINVRRTPDLAFQLDQSREYSDRVQELLDGIKKAE